MSKKHKLIFILVDALRWDYINNSDSPFLDKLSKSGVSGSALPSFGFEPDAAYLAGLNPDESDGGAMFWKHDKNSDFNFSKFFPNSIDFLPRRINWFFRKIIRLIAQCFGRTNRIKKYCDPCNIPIKYLHKFSYSSVMSNYPWENDFMKNNTIFHYLNNKSMTYYYHCIPDYKVKSKIVCERFLREYNERYDYAFLFIGDLDSVGHKFGPNSIERKNTLQTVDKRIETIYNHALKFNKNLNIIILGDHGMAEVDKSIDIEPSLGRLKKNGLKFDYFVDATMLRIWSKHKSTQRKIFDEINKIDGLIYIDKKLELKYSINYSHNFFWDQCWQVNDGCILHPNFFSTKSAPIGMHGYLPDTQDNKPAYIVHSSNINLKSDKVNDIDMKIFYQLQKALLGFKKININNIFNVK
mgnify:CR=1 FL=1|tara:strand:+ start:2595 stop:3824 length:1230 start_codon:yes stop_codon:yes gene_type:complete